jgi:two-component system OmpR family sensor kinase
VKGTWLVAPLPALLGIGGAVLAASARENPILSRRADVGTLLLLSGFFLSGLMTAWFLALHLQARRSRRRGVAQGLAQAAQERRRFLRRLDHELKNPLTAMRAGLANLAWVSSDEARREALGSVEAQTLRLSRLAADLRKLAELETRPLERTAVNVGDLMQEVLHVAQEHPQARQRRLTLTLPQAPWPLPTISGDQDLLFLAVHNLVDNALKFTRPGDTVEMRAFEDGARLVIEVADTGPGIPAAEVAHIWEELYRGQGARGIAGSGLGLALARAIVERHKGQVGLRSREGQGTVFMMRLPLR